MSAGNGDWQNVFQHWEINLITWWNFHIFNVFLIQQVYFINSITERSGVNSPITCPGSWSRWPDKVLFHHEGLYLTLAPMERLFSSIWLGAKRLCSQDWDENIDRWAPSHHSGQMLHLNNLFSRDEAAQKHINVLRKEQGKQESWSQKSDILSQMNSFNSAAGIDVKSKFLYSILMPFRVK